MHLKTAIGAVLASYVSTCATAPASSFSHDTVLIERDTAKYVFAHFMIGIVPNYQVDDWKMDMTYAMEIGIDAFALNHAVIDSYSPTQLADVYQAAQEMGFKVFISFNFAYWNNGDEQQTSVYMQQYSNHPVQMQYNGSVVVSTFVGDSFDWGPVKAN